jgi:hypothetical protein
LTDAEPLTIDQGWLRIGPDGHVELWMAALCFPCSFPVPGSPAESVPAVYCAHTEDPSSPTLLCTEHAASWRVTANPPITRLHALDVPCRKQPEGDKL